MEKLVLQRIGKHRQMTQEEGQAGLSLLYAQRVKKAEEAIAREHKL